jgi:hypothetical protein
MSRAPGRTSTKLIRRENIVKPIVKSSVRTLLVCAVTALPLAAHAALTTDRLSSAELAAPEILSGPNMTIPLQSWPVDVQSFIDARKAAAKQKGNLKAATDPATVYRPIPVCRLVDTRGNPAWITIAGPLLAGSTTPVPAAGRCGSIPSTGVAGLSVSFHVLNLTPNNGGTIALLSQGSPPNGVNAVFNPGAQWTASTANISIPDDSGNFEIQIVSSNVQVVIDVNGYYQDLDFVDTGTQELDIHGKVSCASPGCKVFEVTNEGNGAAVVGTNLGGGPGVKVGLGSFAVAGAGINSGTAAFILEVNAAGAFGAGGNICGGNPNAVVIDHPMLNGDANAIVLVTPRENTPTSVGGTSPAVSGGFSAYYVNSAGPCAPSALNHWVVRQNAGSTLPNRSQFSVCIIKAQ